MSWIMPLQVSSSTKFFIDVSDLSYI